MMVQVKGALIITFPANVATGGVLFALTPRNISSAGYSSLGAIMPLVNGVSGNYNRFMVTNLRLRPFMLTGYNAGGLVAVNYEADDSSVSAPPTALPDVTRSRHYAMSTPFEAHEIRVQPQQYFNDWKDVNPVVPSGTTVLPYPQAGISQIYCTTQIAATVGSDVAVVEIECDVYFEGLRYTP